jgi:hypothetical protein
MFISFTFPLIAMRLFELRDFSYFYFFNMIDGTLHGFSLINAGKILNFFFNKVYSLMLSALM